ncbi:MAG: L,D-transpeptidase family protein [Hyphomicrobiaceae bacterium]|nr:L,D-transpeptidase family protein [Hyphomicrobiaceae bacterium]
MRSAAVLLSGLALLAIPGVAGAEVAVRPVVAEVAVPAPQPARADALLIDVLREVTARRERADQETGELLDALGTVYADGLARPVFVDHTGMTERGRAVLWEVSRADEWGLEPGEYSLREADLGAHDAAGLARLEVEIALVALRYASHASQGRFAPTEFSLWYERARGNFDALGVLSELARSSDVHAVLTAQHPQHRQFQLLRAAYLHARWPDRFAAPGREAAPEPERFAPGAPIERGMRDGEIVKLRQLLDVPARNAADADLYDREVERAVTAFMRTRGVRGKTVFDDTVRRALNSDGKPAKRTTQAGLQELRVNMEKWRWMPRELGNLHIINHLPSFETRVVRDGKTVHAERIIVGKTNTQTPVFSDQMTHVVFKPQWGVPNSIKIKTLLPSLAGGDLGVLDRRGMSIVHEGRRISPTRYNWSKTDISSVPIVMGAGPSNPLGRLKFMFPNHHAVYMHDTPDRHLFGSADRTFSAGCIRVRNPVRLAEVVFSEASGWAPERVADYLGRFGEENHRVDLDRPIPVHNTYFTLVADEAGGFVRYKDIYGHDRRIAEALSGKSLELIARSDPARAQQRELKAMASNARAYAIAAARPKLPPPGFGLPPGVGFYGYQQALGGPVPPTFAPKPQKPARAKSSNPYAKNPARMWSIQAFGGY